MWVNGSLANLGLRVQCGSYYLLLWGPIISINGWGIKSFLVWLTKGNGWILKSNLLLYPYNIKFKNISGDILLNISIFLNPHYPPILKESRDWMKRNFASFHSLPSPPKYWTKYERFKKNPSFPSLPFPPIKHHAKFFTKNQNRCEYTYSYNNTICV